MDDHDAQGKGEHLETLQPKFTPARIIVYANAAIASLLATYFFLIPGCLVARNVCDPPLKEGQIPREAWRMHRYLAPRYERWARDRIASEKAAEVHHLNVSGTEWPLYGSVFYLWATEYLQDAWEQDPSLSREAPAVYARDTIEACKDILLDPAHHTWVREHWGDDYMHDQNVFFRSLIIAGLTSYERLVGTGEHLPMLRDQIDTLAAELDASPYGVLYDYPGECYPIDVFAAVAWIKRADVVAGTDHSAFLARERRAFDGPALDANGLIPWLVDPRTGRQLEESRGIVNAHILIFAPDLYPDLAEVWYDRFEKLFWQEKWWGAGFREFHLNSPKADATFDVDSGPLVGGFSPSANGFAIAAARRNGRLDHAYTLAAQVLTLMWPLPDGRSLTARMLSDRDDAPYLAETAVLWQLTETAPESTELVRGGRLTGAVYIGLALYFGISLLVLLAVFLRIRRYRRRKGRGHFRLIRAQFVLWALCMIAMPVSLACGTIVAAVVALLLAQFFPALWKKSVGEEGGQVHSEIT